MRDPAQPPRTPVPAVILSDARTGSLRIAGLALVDRLVVALHRAGCRPITVVWDQEPPALPGSRALGIAVGLTGVMPPLSGPTVLADAGVLATTDDLRRVRELGGYLTDGKGVALPIGRAEAWRGSVEASLDGECAVPARGVVARVTDDTSAEIAERALWRSMGSPSDGWVDTWFNRPLSRWITKVLVHTRVTPNQVTVGSTAIGLGAAGCFMQGTHDASVYGALLLQAAAMVDCVDGELARVMFKETTAGKWLDLGLDQVVHVAVFATIAAGLARQGSAAPLFWLGLSAVLGALISFGLVVRGWRRLRRQPNPRLERLLDLMCTRDFTVLLLALALVDGLEWFLWMAGTGVHGFWLLVLAFEHRTLGPDRRSP